ncbi:MAG TPA: hypothetical protein VFE31_03410 [Opitutaceae bacterium]|jgi:hypothetical protein|nr:hypothetical protein [Opitutaceae bacterium]
MGHRPFRLQSFLGGGRQAPHLEAEAREVSTGCVWVVTALAILALGLVIAGVAAFLLDLLIGALPIAIAILIAALVLRHCHH